MSSASAPGSAVPRIPAAPPPGPAIVQPGPAPSRPRRGMGLWLVLLAVVGAGAAYYWKVVRTAPAGPSGPGPAAVRTVTVGGGDLTRTVRVNGVISAERFASIMAPQMYGRRDGGGFSSSGRSRGGGMSGGGSSSGGSSSGGSSSSSSGSSSYQSATANFSGSRSGGSSSAGSSGSDSSSSAASSMSSGSTSGSTGRSSLGAVRGTTNRFSDRSRSSSRGSGSSRSSGAASEAMGGGLGSTSSGLMSGGGGGGGGGGSSRGSGGGFGMVLLKLTPGGTRVKKGDVVAEFDRESQLRRLDDYRAGFIQTEASIKKMKAEMAVSREAMNQRILVAKAELDKARLDLKTIEVRSAIESEHFRLALEEAEAAYKQILEEVKLFDASERARFRISEIERDQSRIELRRAEGNVEKMLLKAPIDGIVVMQTTFRGGEFGQVQEGDQVSAGQPFMQIVDPDSMIINASVNQVDSEAIRIGMKAMVRLDAYPELRLPGRVVGIAAMARNIGFGRAIFAREVPIRLKLEALDPRVIPDLTGSAEIEIATERDATLAPLAGVFHDSGKPFVFVQRPDGWIRREVELGPANHLYAAVRSGVSKGERIAAERPPAPNNQISR